MSQSSRAEKEQRQLSPAATASIAGLNSRNQRREEQFSTTEQLDLFSSFIFDTPEPTDTRIIVGVGEQSQLALSGDMIPDDIFGEMDPQTSYRDEDLDFFNFLDTTKDLPKFPHSAASIEESQSQPAQQQPTNLRTFSSANAETHRGIVIPANINANPPIQPKTLAPIAPNPHTSQGLPMHSNPSISTAQLSMPPLPPSAFASFPFNS